MVSDTSKTTFDFNDVLPMIGEFGWYQIRLLIILILLSTSAMHQLVLIYFLSGPIQWRCAGNSTLCNTTQVFETGDKRFCSTARNDWEYYDDGSHSVEKYFDLYCGEEWKIHLSTSIFWIGYVIGIPIFGWLTDHYGRKMSIMPTFLLMNIFGLLLSFVPNMELFYVCRFLSGMFIPSHIQMFILLQEFVGNSKRNLAGMLFWICVQLSAVILTTTAYFIPSWKIFNIFSTAPYLLLGFCYLLIPESPRWLLLHGKKGEANDLTVQIAKSNGGKLPRIFEFRAANEKTNLSSIEILRNKTLFIRNLALSFGWFSGCLGYYGMTHASSDLPGSKYVNFILINAIEIPALIVSSYTGDKFGRKVTTISSMIIGGSFGIGSAFISSDGALGITRITLAIVGKFFMTVAYLMVWNWSVEIYPTNVRAVGLAINQFFSKIGGVSMPWISKYLLTIHNSLPFLVMGVLAVVGGILMSWLPETKGRDLQESIKEKDVVEETIGSEVPLL